MLWFLNLYQAQSLDILHWMDVICSVERYNPQKGLINPLPDLSDLNEGDLKYNVDFKNVYATVLKKWLNADDSKILQKQYEYLNFI